MDDWNALEAATGWKIPDWVREGCSAPKLVTIPAGRELSSAGPDGKSRMEWGAFEENDLDWYFRGNQLDPAWYSGRHRARVAIYQYRTTLTRPTRAIISKVAPQPGAPMRSEPAKFQYYTPLGLGAPTRGRLLGYLEVDDSFTPAQDVA